MAEVFGNTIKNYVMKVCCKRIWRTINAGNYYSQWI